ncbi:FecR family protein [Flavobacterium sp. MAHUQ-51]|uniref:FecR family protein n=1 Tax=Flavobacterium sp. GCM10022190 TaxID=3252639 RepID=UPI00360A52C8
MTILHKILQLSDQIAVSLLNNKKAQALEETDLFSESEKTTILSNITDPDKIQSRKELLHQIDKKEDWKKIKSKIQFEETTPVRYLTFFKYAAAVLLLVGASFYFLQTTVFDSANSDAVVVVKDLAPGTDKATLTLANGKQVALVNGVGYNANGVQSNGKEIVYSSDVKAANNEFNYLSIPRGGQFYLQLSDGTKVWLNSKSVLKYPVLFGGNQRTVFLEGEAYFEVSKNPHKPFNVVTKSGKITVLGTQFNVSSYAEDNYFATTLAEGKVRLSELKTTVSKDKVIDLKPGQQANYHPNNGGKLIVGTVDVEKFSAWKEGKFYFENESLKDILNKLARWYNFDVQFENNKIEEILFTGFVLKQENLSHILEIISKTSNIKYTITEKNQNYEVKIMQ